jgi:hypothetical protein
MSAVVVGEISAVLLVVVIGAFERLRQQQVMSRIPRPPQQTDAEAEYDGNPYRLAYLAGGEPHLAATVLLRLSQLGLVRVSLTTVDGFERLKLDVDDERLRTARGSHIAMTTAVARSVAVVTAGPPAHGDKGYVRIGTPRSRVNYRVPGVLARVFDLSAGIDTYELENRLETEGMLVSRTTLMGLDKGAERVRFLAMLVMYGSVVLNIFTSDLDNRALALLSRLIPGDRFGIPYAGIVAFVVVAGGWYLAQQLLIKLCEQFVPWPRLADRRTPAAHRYLHVRLPAPATVVERFAASGTKELTPAEQPAWIRSGAIIARGMFNRTESDQFVWYAAEWRDNDVLGMRLPSLTRLLGLPGHRRPDHTS